MTTKEARSSSWPCAVFQPELLGLVLLRLPSLVDRVRLRAVCRPWRSNAPLQPLPPPLPWLTLLDGTSLTIPDGRIIRMLAPHNAFCCGSTDSCLFFVHVHGGCSLMNPFSKATLELPKVPKEWFKASSRLGSSFRKMVVSPSPLESSPGSLVAALILDNGGTIRICQPPIATCSLSVRRNYLYDIAFFNGKLYGLGIRNDELSTFEVNCGHDSKPKISRVKCITNSPGDTDFRFGTESSGKFYMLKKYLVECCGSLLLVIRWIETADRISCLPLQTASFEIFEADLSTKPGQWRRVLKLGGQALFVGQYCCRSFPAGEYTGIQEDCIYFMCDYRPEGLAVDPLHDSGVYNMRNGIITPLLSETAAMPRHRGGQWRPTWLFPADAV